MIRFWKRLIPSFASTQKKRPAFQRLGLEPLETRDLMAVSTIDFQDLNLAANSAWNGPDPFGAEVADPFGGELPIRDGKFTSGGAAFTNIYNPNFDVWSDFAFSNITDNTTKGFSNQRSAYAGKGFNDANYAVAYADQTDPTKLANMPTITLPGDSTISSIAVTNTTYAALSMLQGDSFAKKFGGASGNEADWFKLTVYGTNAAGETLPNTAEIYLADYRFSDNAQDFIQQDWVLFDLSSLASARRLYFSLSSSDVGSFGMNTPSYFAIDQLVLNDPTPNRAPVLNTTATPTLGSIAEDTLNPAGISTLALLGNAVSDANANDPRGVAITGTGGAANGTWQLSTDTGTNWQALGARTSATSLLLPANAQTLIRFVPKANFFGSVSLYYRAWDQTQSSAGQPYNFTVSGSSGGKTAFSAGVAKATLTITPVNDAPIIEGISGARSYKRLSAAAYLATTGSSNVPTARVSDDNANLLNGKLSVSISSGGSSGNRLALGGPWFVVDANRQVIRKDSLNGDKVIGTLNVNGGVGTTLFEVTFNANATPLLAQQLIRSLTFATVLGTDLNSRVIDITLTDGLGGVSNKISKTINLT